MDSRNSEEECCRLSQHYKYRATLSCVTFCSCALRASGFWGFRGSAPFSLAASVFAALFMFLCKGSMIYIYHLSYRQWIISRCLIITWENIDEPWVTSIDKEMCSNCDKLKWHNLKSSWKRVFKLESTNETLRYWYRLEIMLQELCYLSGVTLSLKMTHEIRKENRIKYPWYAWNSFDYSIKYSKSYFFFFFFFLHFERFDKLRSEIRAPI